MTNATTPTEQVADQAIKALEDCLSLIADMSRFVGHMALQDYALFYEAPMAGREAIMALGALRAQSVLVRRLAVQQKPAQS